MFKSLSNIDEIENSHILKGSSLNKVEKKIKKEIIEKEKPINPNFIFKNLNKKVKNSKYRKPKPSENEKPKLNIFIGDY
tara:strand:- start:1041 stop:1277 length:237 start_codon:yes stop_codon:yes gene_type:complete